MRKQLTREELKVRRWLKALNIAKILFEEDGYFTDYLEEIEAFIGSGNEKGKQTKNRLRKELAKSED